MQVRAMAELQQAPALAPTQGGELPESADGAGAEPDETMLGVAEKLVKLNLRKHIKTAMNKGNTWIRSCRSGAKRIARDLRRVPLEACTTCFSRVQRAEVERRKRVKARHERVFWPSIWMPLMPRWLAGRARRRRRAAAPPAAKPRRVGWTHGVP